MKAGETEKRVKRLARHYRYNHSGKGILRRFRYYDNHQAELCEKSRKWREAHPDYFMQWYYKTQDEIGYHGDPRDVLRGARFLQALINAPVVEGKSSPEELERILRSIKR